MTTTTERPWQADIVAQLGDATLEVDAPDATHAAVFVPTDSDRTALLLGTAESELAAIILGEDKLTSVTGGEADLAGGEVRIVKLDDLYRWQRARTAGEEEPDVEAAVIEPRRENVAPDPDVEVEIDEQEPEQAETPEPAPGEQAQAFDASDYEREDLQIPKVDGETIDKIRVKFAGSVMLDRSDPADVALYNRLKLGKEVELRCAGTVKGTGTGFTTNRDGDLDVVVGEKSITVDSVWVLDPEQLGADA